MTELSPEDRAAIVQEALRFKFGRLLEWARPTILHPFGPNNLLVVDEYETRLEYTKKVVVDALSEWADEKLLKLSGSLKERRRLADEEWNALGNPAIQELFSLQPGPLAYGFGHPSLKADFEYWGKMPKLTIYETVALSVGADPAAFPAERFTNISAMKSQGSDLWAALVFISKQFELFRRHFTPTGSGFFSETPDQLKAWIDKFELVVHPEFYAELSKRSPETKVAVPSVAPPNLNRQERETLLKLIAAMACEQYNFDPSKGRNDATSRILEDIDLVGLSMDVKTIRKWLNEAAKLVDSSYWTKSG